MPPRPQTFFYQRKGARNVTPKQAITRALANCGGGRDEQWEPEADEVLYELAQAGFSIVPPTNRPTGAG
jgi:hypothetical protein